MRYALGIAAAIAAEFEHGGGVEHRLVGDNYIRAAGAAPRLGAIILDEGSVTEFINGGCLPDHEPGQYNPLPAVAA